MRGRRYRRRETPCLRLGSRRRAAPRWSDSRCRPVGRIPDRSMLPRSPAPREARHRGSAPPARPNARRARRTGPRRHRPGLHRRCRRHALRQGSRHISRERFRRRSRRDGTLSTRRTRLPPEATARAAQGSAMGSRTSARHPPRYHGIAVGELQEGPPRAEHASSGSTPTLTAFMSIVPQPSERVQSARQYC